MNTRKLGSSNLHLTTIGLGAWAIGGGENPIGWGPQDDNDSIATIRRAIELGINWIDTAAVYGQGHSEEVVGQAIKGIRDKVIIATKCGILWKKDETGKMIFPRDLKTDSMRRQVEESLRRLCIETIDLLQIHIPPNPDTDIEEGWTAISDLIREGKVRYPGVSNFTVNQMKRVQSIYRIASLQPPYSMVNRAVERELLPYCLAKNIGVIPYSPMERGLLTGKMTRQRIAQMPEDDHRKKAVPFQEPHLSATLELIEGLKPIAEEKGITLGQLSIAWVLKNPAITSVIVGARRPDQVEETAKAGDIELSQDEIGRMETLLAKREATIVA